MVLLRLTGGLIAVLMIALAAAFVRAQDYNRGFSIEEYEAFPALLPGGGFDRNIVLYHTGLIAGMQAAKEDYVAAGRTPLFCLPHEMEALNLVQLIEHELAADGHTWRRTSDATAAKLALYVVQKKHPCPAPAGTKEGLRDPGFKVATFRLWVFMADAKQRKNEKENTYAEGLAAFVTGGREVLMAASEIYAAKGTKSRFCIPSNLHAIDLIDVLAEEFDGDQAYWDKRKEEPLMPVAIQIFAMKWPCK